MRELGLRTVFLINLSKKLLSTTQKPLRKIVLNLEIIVYRLKSFN